MYQGASCFSVKELFRVWTSSTKYLDNQLLRCRNVVLSSVKRDVDTMAAVFNKKLLSAPPLIANSELAPEQVVIAPPTMHVVVHLSQLVLSLFINNILPSQDSSRSDFMHHLESQRMVMSNGNITAAGSTFRRMISEYV